MTKELRTVETLSYSARIAYSVGFLLLCPGRTSAMWLPNGTVVSTAGVTGIAQNAFLVCSVQDGLGGVILTWQDERNFYTSGSDVYAQRITAAGNIAPGWPPDGLAISTADFDQKSPVLVADGVGGAIIAWQDDRNGSRNTDIYSVRVTCDGAIAPGWPSTGLPICTATYYQDQLKIAIDGAGGAFLVWTDLRNSSVTGSDIFIQHVTKQGNFTSGWPLNGLAVCDTTNVQGTPNIVSDDQGGAILTWRDARTGDLDIYVQRITAVGKVAPGWAKQGIVLCAIPGNQGLQAMVSDGLGGAIVAWEDPRNGVSPFFDNIDIYAQRVTCGGSIQPGWTLNGVAVCTDWGHQASPVITGDGAGGAIVSWSDSRGIYSQHMNSNGTIPPGWPIDGLGVSNFDYSRVTTVSDGVGGAFVAWEDLRHGSSGDIYAQRITGSGSIATSWLANGNPVCMTVGQQAWPSMVSDGHEGVIISWEDQRSGSPPDIYASRIGPSGQVVTSTGISSTIQASIRLAGPNPCRQEVRFRLLLSSEALVSLDVFDASGRVVRRLLRETIPAGERVVSWDGRGPSFARLPAGVYWLRARWQGFDGCQKFVLSH